jgi:hypothetical protein
MSADPQIRATFYASTRATSPYGSATAASWSQRRTNCKPACAPRRDSRRMRAPTLVMVIRAPSVSTHDQGTAGLAIGAAIGGLAGVAGSVPVFKGRTEQRFPPSVALLAAARRNSGLDAWLAALPLLSGPRRRRS